MWSGNWEVVLKTELRPCRVSRMLGEMVTYKDLIVPRWGVESRACVMTPQTKPGLRTEERNPVLRRDLI